MRNNYIIAANWKMNKTPQECYNFVKNLRDKLLDKPDVNIILCAPFTSLFYISSFFDIENLDLGAQNKHWASEGAYTGEISPEMLLASSVKWVILGHSERRHIFGETIDEITKKVVRAVREGLRPIFCFGEKLEERREGKTKEVLVGQLSPIIDRFNESDLQEMLFAYEPVWAIGTGLNAEPDQIQEAHNIVREFAGENVRILYGGSVTPANATELINVKGVDGFLVGGASLELESIWKIINCAHNVRIRSN